MYDDLAKNGPIELDTPRLRLRQWRDSDLPKFIAMGRCQSVMEFFPALLSREQSEQWAAETKARIAQQGWGLWALELKSRRQFIGFVGLNCPRVPLPFSPCTELGWRLAKAYWGQGYATEAAKCALRFGFEQLCCEEIVAFTASLNQRSQSVMKKLGMRNTHNNFFHPSIERGHRLSAHVLYALTLEQGLAFFNKPE